MESEKNMTCLNCAMGSPQFHVYVATILVLASFVWFFFYSNATHLLPLIVVTGMGGGVISIYIRLRGGSGEGGYDGELLFPKIQAYISPLVAGMLALLFHGFMAAEIVTGTLFPDFKNSEGAYTGVRDFLTSLSPNTNVDAAKALVWAFIAGFSERLVPNVLDTLGNKAAVKTE